MPKVNLGKVAILPWTNLYDMFYYPPATNINVVGGYKIYGEKIYLCFSAKFNANDTLIFPMPTENFEIEILKNGEPITINFNGSISGNTGDIITSGGVYYKGVVT